MIEMAELSSPLGDVRVAVREESLCALGFVDACSRTASWLGRRFPGEPYKKGNALTVSLALAAYFDGDLHALEHLSVDLGGTEFQSRVWAELKAIPPGVAISYSELARAAGAPRAVRAVGGATGANPVGLVVPCHRVIRADGQIGEYGGGDWRKRWLLEHERVVVSGADALVLPY